MIVPFCTQPCRDILNVGEGGGENGHGRGYGVGRREVEKAKQEGEEVLLVPFMNVDEVRTMYCLDFLTQDR